MEANLVYSTKRDDGLRSGGLISEGLYPQSKKSDYSVRNLALAILLQAFRDVIAPKKSSNKEWDIWRKDAMEWFFDAESYPGSFAWVCDILQMNPEELRIWVRTYKKSSGANKREMVKRLVRFQIPH